MKILLSDYVKHHPQYAQHEEKYNEIMEKVRTAYGRVFENTHLYVTSEIPYASYRFSSDIMEFNPVLLSNFTPELFQAVVAHELGHKALKHSAIYSLVNGPLSRREECEADHFSQYFAPGEAQSQYFEGREKGWKPPTDYEPGPVSSAMQAIHRLFVQTHPNIKDRVELAKQTELRHYPPSYLAFDESCNITKKIEPKKGAEEALPYLDVSYIGNLWGSRLSILYLPDIGGDNVGSGHKDVVSIRADGSVEFDPDDLGVKPAYRWSAQELQSTFGDEVVEAVALIGEQYRSGTPSHDNSVSLKLAHERLAAEYYRRETEGSPISRP